MGLAEPIAAQTFYEAVALAVDEGLSPNTIILVQPSSPYVCVGFHQELEREVDIDYCRNQNLPILRRSQGGGAVYLDSDQLFYQVVAREESEVVPLGVEELFEKFLSITVYVYRSLGLQAGFKAVNDVVVDGRKISGNGAGNFGDNTAILIGNIIFDLDYKSMVRVLKVPNEKFRDKTVKSMREWVTSLRKELEIIPSADKIKELLVKGYEEILGIKLIPSKPTKIEEKIWREKIVPRHLSREWLYMTDLRREGFLEGRSVKIAGDVRVIEVAHKARKLIRVSAELVGNKIQEIIVSGDFFMVPEESFKDLELALRSTILERDTILSVVQSFYKKTKVQTPGLSQEDFVEAIMELRKVR